MAKEYGFPEKRPLPTAGCRVFTMCVSPPPCPRVSHPSTLSLKTWYELLVHEWSRWSHSWWWWCIRVHRGGGADSHKSPPPPHQFTVSLSGLSCCFKGVPVSGREGAVAWTLLTFDRIMRSSSWGQSCCLKPISPSLSMFKCVSLSSAAAQAKELPSFLAHVSYYLKLEVKK